MHAYLINLRNIAKIRMYLTFESTKTLVHAYVTCRLDNCNSLLLGSPDYIIQKLQRVQNCAARLAAGQPRAAHIRPVLKELHWLPVEQRITFKVLLLFFKALNNLAPPYLGQLIVPYNPTPLPPSSFILVEIKKLLIVMWYIPSIAVPIAVQTSFVFFFVCSVESYGAAPKTISLC